MIAAMVGGLLLLIAGLILVWLLSPAFRHWTERPKFQMLERDALYERASAQAHGSPLAELPETSSTDLARRTP